MAKKLEGTELARAQWQRYVYLNDTHHRSFVEKAQRCDELYAGDNHWDHSIKSQLQSENRPALTINMIFATIQAMTGEQIVNRSETSYRPRANGATDEVAAALTKVSRQIDDNNEYDYLKTDVFEDGVIMSRGFFDVRVEFDDHLQGEVAVTKEDPRNIIPDGDASSYDPKDWRDVTKSTWQSIEDIENNYDVKSAERLANKPAFGEDQTFGRDSVNVASFATSKGYWGGFPSSLQTRDGTSRLDGALLGDPEFRFLPTIRVVERQYRLFTEVESFWFPETGDLREIPETWDEDRIRGFRDYANQNIGRTETISEKKKKIRWTVSADDQILFDAWSPYRSFTIIPYFPHFRYGRTIGAVENVIDAQELLNKTLSQELHIINTTANSGWMVEEDSLVNMDTDELQQRGAQTGLNIVYRKGAEKPEKIQPNQVPTGVDRLSSKAQAYIHDVSTITKSVLGQDREDVAARAIEAKQGRAAVNLSRIMDNLERTEKLYAKKKLELIQQFYTEERVIQIAGKSAARPEQEIITINQQTPEGEVINDLTLGEYNVVVTSVPARDSLEDTQFEEAVRLKELGIEVPDETLIEVSRLPNRSELAKEIAQAKEDPVAQQLRKAEAEETMGKARLRNAEVAFKEAETEKVKFEAAKALAALKQPEADPDFRQAQLKLELAREDHEHQRRMRELELEANLKMTAERNAREIELIKARNQKVSNDGEK